MFGLFRTKPVPTRPKRPVKNRQHEDISYTIRSYAKSRSIRLIIKPDTTVTVTKPLWVTIAQAQEFLINHVSWIRTQIHRTATKPKKLIPAGNTADLRRHRSAAIELIHNRIAHYNAQYKFTIGRISIRNQSTRWGSCSSRGNLNFNYNIVHLPPELADYLIVHELCHLQEMNHSQRFWDLVGQTIPDYKKLRQQLKLL